MPQSFVRAATTACSSKRNPPFALDGSRSGTLVAHLPLFYCTPIDPMYPDEPGFRPQTQVPYDALQCQIEGSLDVLVGDYITEIASGREFAVRGSDYFEFGTEVFRHLTLEEMRK